MRISVKALLALVACALFAGTAFAATVTVDPAQIVNGYMNVYDLSYNYLWGSPWALGDLTAVYSGSNLVLGPNSIGDANEYWYIGGGAPGNPGNKIMFADSYAQVDDGSLAGQSLTFTGTVLVSSLTSAHVAKAFVRDFAPDFSSFNQTIVDLPASGDFSVTLALVADPARHVQWGFEVIGACVWFTDRAPFGTVTVAPYIPVADEATSFGGVKALFR
jgi:hypothetical protein